MIVADVDTLSCHAACSNLHWQNMTISHIHHRYYLKIFIAKRVNSILVNLRYLKFKLLKYKENNKKICNTFDHNFKNIPLYIMRKVSLERYYFVLYDGALTLKMSKMALNSFCDKTLHLLMHNLQSFSRLPRLNSSLTRWRWFDFLITHISHRPQPEYTWD